MRGGYGIATRRGKERGRGGGWARVTRLRSPQRSAGLRERPLGSAGREKGAAALDWFTEWHATHGLRGGCTPAGGAFVQRERESERERERERERREREREREREQAFGDTSHTIRHKRKPAHTIMHQPTPTRTRTHSQTRIQTRKPQTSAAYTPLWLGQDSSCRDQSPERTTLSKTADVLSHVFLQGMFHLHASLAHHCAAHAHQSVPHASQDPVLGDACTRAAKVLTFPHLSCTLSLSSLTLAGVMSARNCGSKCHFLHTGPRWTASTTAVLAGVPAGGASAGQSIARAGLRE